MRFLSRFLGSLAVIALAYLAIVGAIDPRGEFGTHWLPPSIENARVSKQLSYSEYSAEASVQGLILGSSRSMLLPPSHLKERTGFRFFNFAVNDATVEDFLAIFRWTSRKGASLSHLVIGIDGYVLFDGPMNDDLVRNGPLLEAFLGYPAGFPSLTQRLDRDASLYRAVFALPYLKAALYSIGLQLVPGHLPPATYEDPDGVLRDAKFEKRVAAGTFRLEDELPGSVNTLRGYFSRAGAFSEARRTTLETLVREAREHDTRVTLWMTPLHPVVIDHMSSETRYTEMLAQTRAALHDLAERYGAEVYDFSSPDKFGGIQDGFLDGGHVDARNAIRIIDAMTGGDALGL